MVEHLPNQLAGCGVGTIKPKRRLPLESGVGHLSGLSHDFPTDQVASPCEHSLSSGNPDMRGQRILHRMEPGFKIAL